MGRRSPAEELEWDVLRIVADSKDPVGAVSLALTLSETHQTSQAAIGRLLWDLDRRGLTTRVSNKGRVLTEKGREYYRQTWRRQSSQRENDTFLSTLGGTSLANLIDVMVARRALERETARLAAIHATQDEIAELRRVIERQEEELRAGRYGQESDYDFHNLVAEVSRNKVLQHALTVIRNASEFSVLTSFIRYRTGGTTAGDHRNIVDCIASRDPARAAEAMDQHIGYLTEYIYGYCKAIGLDTISTLQELVQGERRGNGVSVR